jgi:hypothetical protein
VVAHQHISAQSVTKARERLAQTLRVTLAIFIIQSTVEILYINKGTANYLFSN